jgi:hypothetical protein
MVVQAALSAVVMPGGYYCKATKKRWRRSMSYKTLAVAGIAAVAACAIPANAHHSFAMFDALKIVQLEGTVKEFQWTNPHAWIVLNVKTDADSKEWAIEMNGPTGLARQGWVPKTLTPGMPIKVHVHPLRDGKNGGQFLAVTFADGKVMGNPNGRPANAPND